MQQTMADQLYEMRRGTFPAWPSLRRVAEGLRAILRAAGERIGASRSASPTLLRIDERLTLGPKRSLVLVSCCGQRVLLAVTAESISPVLEIDGAKTYLANEAAGSRRPARRMTQKDATDPK